MIERLRSHRKEISSQKGFTLVELLVVIAILAVLILIVIVAINPLEQIKKANDRKWETLVRNLATSTHACITDQLGKGNTTEAFATSNGCADKAWIKAAAQAYVGANIDLTAVTMANNGASPSAVCAYVDAGANGGHTGYTSFNTGTGTTAPVGSGVTTCT